MQGYTITLHSIAVAPPTWGYRNNGRNLLTCVTSPRGADPSNPVANHLTAAVDIQGAEKCPWALYGAIAIGSPLPPFPARTRVQPQPGPLPLLFATHAVRAAARLQTPHHVLTCLAILGQVKRRHGPARAAAVALLLLQLVLEAETEGGCLPREDASVPAGPAAGRGDQFRGLVGQQRRGWVTRGRADSLRPAAEPAVIRDG